MAVEDKETLCELALTHLGIDAEITDLDTDDTSIARTLRRLYIPTLREVLEAHPWSFAKRTFDLLAEPGRGTVTVAANVGTFTVDQDPYLHAGDTLTIGTTEYLLGARTSATVWALTGANVTAQAFTIAKAVTEDPTDDWGYAFRVPSCALVVRRLVDGNRTPIRSNRPLYEIVEDDDGRLLYTDTSDPVTIEYTVLQETTTRYSSLFDRAFAGLLAFHAAPSLTGGDPANLGVRARAVGLSALAEAQARDANEQEPDDDADAELIQVR